MNMFWLKRLKTDESRGQWALPYGDLMSLLLAVFVMIAAMSELRDNGQFRSIAGGVRNAFGFSAIQRPSSLGGLLNAAQPTLLERLEQMCIAGSSTANLIAAGDDDLTICEMVARPDCVILRISGEVAFEPFSAVPSAGAERAIKRLADYLAAGQAELEVRGHCSARTLPADIPYRDAWDLSYERARRVASLLEQAGISRERLYVSVWGAHDPLVTDDADGLADESQQGDREIPAANRRIEMIVHAVPTAWHANKEIAEKEQGSNG